MAFAYDLTLAVSDLTGGTGQATVGGLTTGLTTNLYAAPFTGSTGVMTFTQVATGVASGPSLVLSAAPGFGFWIWQAVQLTVGGDGKDATPILYQPLSQATGGTGPEAVWEACLDSVLTLITSMNLSGLPAPKLLKEWFPRVYRQMNPIPPACLIAPFGAEQYVGQLTGQDDIAYGVIVALVDGLNRGSTTNMRRDLYWRQQISRAFRFQRLTGAPTVFYCEIEPDVVINPDAFAEDLMVSALLFRFHSREPRGLV